HLLAAASHFRQASFCRPPAESEPQPRNDGLLSPQHSLMTRLEGTSFDTLDFEEASHSERRALGVWSPGAEPLTNKLAVGIAMLGVGTDQTHEGRGAVEVANAVSPDARENHRRHPITVMGCT